MTKLTVRQKKSLYNQQAVKSAISQCTTTPFRIKRKGKHCFYITFENSINSFLISKIAKKLGLEITYQSDVRCIMSDDYSSSIC